MSWRIVTYRLGREQSRHRVAVWRELRQAGAVALQSATWAIPADVRFDEGLAKAESLVERGDGRALVFDVTRRDDTDAALEQLYTVEREAEWIEFCSECDKALVELRCELARETFTLVELDEEEHSLDRLRRWHCELRARDLFGAPSSSTAETQLKTCVGAARGVRRACLQGPRAAVTADPPRTSVAPVYGAG
ncbi:MAG: Chromate resistance protein ChrB [Acidimicrobiales bacterium]